MFCDKLTAIIEAAVTVETQSAKEQHGDVYRSAHEALGVIEEERFELDAEVDAVFELISEDLILALHEQDDLAMIDTLRLIEQTARSAAMEAIQVAAVARKFAETIAIQGGKDNA